MAELKQDRDAGRRRAAKHGGKSLLAPTLGVHTSELGEHRMNIKQVYALEAMWQTHPAVQAARTVLHSQLLSGGLQLVRDGETLKEVKYGEKGKDGKNKKGITSHFKDHLEEHWLPFAKEVIDCFVRSRRDLSHLRSAAHVRTRAQVKWGFAPVVLDVLEEDPAVEAIRRLKNEVGVDGGKRKRGEAPPPKLVPHVPTLGAWLGWS